MERVLTATQMRVADKFNTENLGISEDMLVKRAGACVAEEIIDRLHGGRVLVCIGKGNNGEDGRVVADILSKKHGFGVTTLYVPNGLFRLFEKKYDIIVDCIFGTGLNREVDGKYKTAIELINKSGAFVVSCDIASGLNGDNGLVMGVAVKANLTVAIQEYKTGHFLNDGPDYSGEVVVKDVGISVWEENCIKKFTDDDLGGYFGHRNRNVHKGCFGKTTVIGGSKRFPGSALLSLNALTALKSGAGYSNLAVPESLYEVYACKNPECTVTPVKDKDGEMTFDEKALETLLKYDSIALGMGMGVSEDVYSIIKYLLSNYKGKLVIDADGLNALAQYGTDVLLTKQCSVILTPHIGEFARLTLINKDIILSDIIDIAKAFAEKFGVTLALKSAVSVITDGEEVFLNVSGSAGMAKGGSGDVLSGIISGMLAYNDDVTECVAAACYLFGRAGERAQKKQNEYTMTASDIIAELPFVINSVSR